MSRVFVDEDLCIGSGDCERLVPAAFRVDEERNVSVVLDGSERAEWSALEAAARNCPTQAISLAAGPGDGPAE